MSETNKSPTHRVYTLIPRHNDKGEDDKFWLNIGSVFVHADGKGFNIILEAMPLDGKLVMREVKEPEPEPKKFSKRSTVCNLACVFGRSGERQLHKGWRFSFGARRLNDRRLCVACKKTNL